MSKSQGVPCKLIIRYSGTKSKREGEEIDE
nr:MAG TPA: hypothetical protein [Caudoviricetes sp.]